MKKKYGKHKNKQTQFQINNFNFEAIKLNELIFVFICQLSTALALVQHFYGEYWFQLAQKAKLSAAILAGNQFLMISKHLITNNEINKINKPSRPRIYNENLLVLIICILKLRL